MKYSPTDFLKIATNTAEHFGFRTADIHKKNPLCKNCEAPLTYTATASDKKNDAQQRLLAKGAEAFCLENLHALEAPVLLYSQDQIPGEDTTTFTFNVFNVPKSIAEAILIQVSKSLMNELEQPDHIVKINSLGDTDSNVRYSRELANYLRKRIDQIPPTARELMKEHPILALMHMIEKDHELVQRSPNPLEYLSDQSRKHFREIVEFLDMTETPYEIDPKMLGHHEYYSDALFSIESSHTEETDPKITISGGRFDEFLYRKTRTRIPAAGAVVTYKDSKQPTRMPKGKTTEPEVYVVQLGFGPKVQSLIILEQLKQAGINVRHDLASDSLSAQLRDAEAREVRYTIIIGQKEFVEQNFILRDMKERNQENLSIDALIKKLKRQITVS